MKKYCILFVLLAFSLSASAQRISYGRYHQLSQPVQMILDSDFGSSTDDLFALMMLHHYIDDGLVDLKGIVVDREGAKNAVLVDVFNHYYGHPDIPIGLERNGVKNPRCFIPYSGIVDLKDDKGEWLFPRSIDPDALPDGYKLYRKLLSQADDHSVVVVAIGFVTTLSELFLSQADEYSPLSGVELFGKKVKAVYIQSGRFESGDHLSGYNMRAASRQSAIFYDNLPKNVDIVMSPSNIGDAMDYAASDVLTDLSYTDRNPIKSVYTQYTCDTGQRMWDTNCLVNAVLGDGEYNMSPRGWVKFIDKGDESQMLFSPDPAGNARYQLPGDTFFAEDKMMDIRRHNRMNRYPSAYTIEAPQPQITGAAAAEWAQQRLNLLADKYMGSAGNTLDPDNVRMLFRPLGFTGPNAADYKEAEQLTVKHIFTRMVEKAVRSGKKDLVIVTGTPGAGKSTAVRELKLKKAGLIYDSSLPGENELMEVILLAKELGVEKVTVVPVYNDLYTSFTNCINRGHMTWRYTALDELVACFRGNAGKLQQIRKNFPDVEILPVDCSHNQGVKQVSLSKALAWNYQVGEAQMQQLLGYLRDIINKGEIEANSLKAVSGNLTAIPGLSARNKLLASEIEDKIEEILLSYEAR